MTQKLSVTIPDAVKLTGLGRSSIYKLINSGALPRRKCGKRTLILMSDLRAYIENLPTDSHEAA